MRARQVLVVVAVGAALAAGCGGGGATGTPMLLLGTNAGLAVLDAATGALDASTGPTIASPGGERLVHSRWIGTRTTLRVDDVATGEEAWWLELEGTYEARTASVGADRIALAPPPAATEPDVLVAGRERTELVVAHEDGRVEQYELEGNIEPEAFSLDGTALFVLSFQPPEAPTSYQVRRLNLRSGELGDVFSVDAELQESMRGTARTQAWDPDGSRLYTLYTDAPGTGGHATTFVHVLDLDEQWAHCVDLPAGLVPDTAGIALADGGDELYVADTLGGMVVAVDTVELGVDRSAEMPPSPMGWPASVAVGDDAVFVSDGAEVLRLDRGSLVVEETFALGGVVVGLQRSRVSDDLFVAWSDGVGVLDPRTGDERRRWPVDTAVTPGRGLPRRADGPGLRRRPVRMLTEVRGP